ncbi:amidohydrolase [Colletotrichum graminicola M1.001]|uniref:Amidohydrolase n=1 Tax=Colletotrichum graminicola (strain M1.001 / M2 / FGSC 10212) TaxID=645133 RepID=E3QFF0_COLGM|nr:amidohydrolase [Colletotrichum graminicola M1.001]EFQ29588.1 amidohydrolase [Colletotrichum graminicola M1.001]
MSDRIPPLITLEEHFIAPDLFSELSDLYGEQLKNVPAVGERLRDVGPLRLADMDANRVSLQVVSHAPGLGARPPAGFGWHQETGLAVLRLFAAGLFDAVPGVKMVIGHFGEMLPFMMERVEKLSPRWGARGRGWRRVWEENIWVTTSGVWGLAPLACVLRNTPVDHVLYSVDYPFEKNENGLAWVRELRDSGMVTPEELDKIAYRNAEKLLRVKAPVIASESNKS